MPESTRWNVRHNDMDPGFGDSEWEDTWDVVEVGGRRQFRASAQCDAEWLCGVLNSPLPHEPIGQILCPVTRKDGSVNVSFNRYVRSGMKLYAEPLPPLSHTETPRDAKL